LLVLEEYDEEKELRNSHCILITNINAFFGKASNDSQSFVC